MSRAEKVIRDEAAEWLALREARGFTVADHAAFAEWCAADARHATIFAEVEASWRTFDRLRAYPHSVDVAADPDLLARPRRVRGLAVASPALAAAAAIAVVAFFGFRRFAETETPALPVTPSIAQVGPRVLRLPDASEVELNAGSEVTEHFTATERRVRLVRGEAHFTVTKNAERPFIVEAGAAAVRAVGTAFNVRLDAGAVDVLVTEGKVQVSPPTPAIVDSPTPAALDAVLVAGQRVVVPSAATPASVVTSPVVETLTAPAIDHALAWQTSRLVFDATPLAEVVARLNRESDGRPSGLRLTVPDARLGAMRISGRIRSGNVENFVEVLEANFGVVAERRGDAEIVLRRR